MKIVGKIISLSVLASAVGLAVYKAVDYAYDKISNRYITFTGKDYKHISENDGDSE